MLYAVSVYERWEDETWEFVGYVKVFHEQNRAIEFAHNSIENSFHACYYRIEAMSEEMVRAGGLRNLIVPLTES